MKITPRGLGNPELSRAIGKDQAVRPGGVAGAKAARSGESARVTISEEARELQQIAQLARAGDEIRAEKVRGIQERIARGEYRVSLEEVSESIIRSEVARLLNEK